jgi:arsenate reductase-like glutaredoxin family protein
MYSKSLFFNSQNLQRTLLYPLGSQSSDGNINSIIFSQDFIHSLKIIEQQYTLNLANRTYSLIPTDYQKYLNLYETVNKTLSKTTNTYIKTLLQITQEGLTGAINAYGLSFENNQLKQENETLQQTIEDILSNKNERPVIRGNDTARFGLQKTFTLAPLFSYYIALYGMPAEGEGFDQNKLIILADILQKNCIPLK